MSTESTKTVQEQEGIRFLYVWFLPGITRLNAIVFCYSAFATIGLLTFI